MKKFFPYLILISALFISITGSFFSIYGLGKLFGGHQLGATILAFAFEFGNIITATALKIYWKHLPRILKIPLVCVVFTLTILTSMGIYGYLSDGYQKTALKDEIVSKKSNLVKIKKENYDQRLQSNKKEIETINNSISELTKAYNQNTQTQQVVHGQVITNVIVTNKKGIENQLNSLTNQKVKLDSVNFSYMDSIQRLELQIIEIENSNETNSELGPLKYLSTLTGTPMNKIVNWLILLIVLVFQPLALMLIITSMFAFKNNHYVNRSSKNKNIDVFSDLKSTWNKFFKKKQPQVIQEAVIPLVSKDIPEPVKEPRKKRNYVKKPKNFTIDIPPDIKEKEVEIPDTADRENNRRRIIDNQLTPDIADHISKSLENKKKVKN